MESSYRTEITVKDIIKAIDFFQCKLGLNLFHYNEKEKQALFWVGRENFSLLYLIEKETDNDEIEIEECKPKFIMHESINYLKNNQTKLWHFLMHESHNPKVFAEVPALVTNFRAINGQVYTFVGMLQTQPKPELGILSLEEWEKSII